jgi:hypothetical protein
LLRIRAEQFEHFARLARSRFIEMMTTYLREEMPDRVPPREGALRAWVERGLALCERSGVTTEPEAAQLLLLLLVLGEEPEQRHAWLPPLVARNGLSPEGKVRAIVTAARAAGLAVDPVIRYPQYLEPEAGAA